MGTSWRYLTVVGAYEEIGQIEWPTVVGAPGHRHTTHMAQRIRVLDSAAKLAELRKHTLLYVNFNGTCALLSCTNGQSRDWTITRGAQKFCSPTASHSVTHWTACCMPVTPGLLPQACCPLTLDPRTLPLEPCPLNLAP